MAKQHSIQRKLSLSYILFILLFVLFIALLSNVIIQYQFNKYAAEKQVNQINQIITQINNQYNNGEFNASGLDVIGNFAVNNGYIITVTDSSGNTVYDANYHFGHKCDMIIDGIRQRMRSQNPNWTGKYVTVNYELNSGTGNVQIGYLSPYFYTDEDITFIQTLNTIYFASSIVFIAIALILAYFMAKRVSEPIEKIVLATGKISEGVYDTIPQNNTGIREINQLTVSMNQLSKSLSEQEQLRKRLTADVTHELRTPLTTLQTHIEAMSEGLLPCDSVQLNSIYEEIIRLNKIVSDLDKLSQYDCESLNLHKEQVNLGLIIENVVNIFKIQFSNKNIALNFDKRDYTIYADKDRMHQVFINLLSNALKYTNYGHVDILMEDDNENVKITVKDTGIGIDEKDLPHIFERFYRADKSRDRKTGGSGIGLTIVKSIIAAHNGKIQADSVSGKGTEIMIYLPKVGV